MEERDPSARRRVSAEVLCAAALFVSFFCPWVRMPGDRDSIPGALLFVARCAYPFVATFDVSGPWRWLGWLLVPFGFAGLAGLMYCPALIVLAVRRGRPSAIGGVLIAALVLGTGLELLLDLAWLIYHFGDRTLVDWHHIRPALSFLGWGLALALAGSIGLVWTALQRAPGRGSGPRQPRRPRLVTISTFLGCLLLVVAGGFAQMEIVGHSAPQLVQPIEPTVDVSPYYGSQPMGYGSPMGYGNQMGDPAYLPQLPAGTPRGPEPSVQGVHHHHH